MAKIKIYGCTTGLEEREENRTMILIVFRISFWRRWEGYEKLPDSPLLTNLLPFFDFIVVLVYLVYFSYTFLFFCCICRALNIQTVVVAVCTQDCSYVHHFCSLWYCNAMVSNDKNVLHFYKHGDVSFKLHFNRHQCLLNVLYLLFSRQQGKRM